MMKLIVDKMPETAKDCLFSAMGTGKPRCRHDVKLCPLQRGEECPHLMEIVSPEPITLVQETPLAIVAEHVAECVAEVPAPKKRTTKRSTAKKAD